MHATDRADWGPVPRLAEELANVLREARGREIRLLEIPEEFGGLWALYGAELLRLLPAWPHPTARPPYWRTPLLGLLWRSHAGPLAIADLHDGLTQLEPLLAKCQAWLARRTLDRMQHFFSALPWRDAPLDQMRVSQKALMWAVAAYLLDSRGPGQIVAAREVINSGGFALEAGDPLGDFISLHLLVEDIVCSLPRRTHSGEIEIVKERAPGGFRTRAFMSAYAVLNRHPLPRRAHRWKEAVSLLVRHSPLTQLVYADLIGAVDESTAYGPLTKLGPPRRWWKDLWMSHLARSAMGMMLSPPPVSEALRDAKNACERRRAVLSQGRGRAAARMDTDPTLRRLEKRQQELARRSREEYIERIAVLAGMAPGGEWRQVSQCFWTRLMDMLLRHLVVCSAGAIQAAKERIAREAPLVRVGNVLFQEGGPCLDVMTRALIGRAWASVGAGTLGGEQQRQLFAFLEPAAPGTAAQVAKEAGVSLESAEGALARFQQQVPLPLPGERSNADAPEAALNDVATALHGRLSVTDQDTVVAEAI